MTSGSSLRLMRKKPSYDELEATEDVLLDFSSEGVLSFQAAIVLRTEFRGKEEMWVSKEVVYLTT